MPAVFEDRRHKRLLWAGLLTRPLG